MKTIQGVLSNLKVVDSLSNVQEMTVLSFEIRCTQVELTSHKEVKIKNGDKIIVAGMENAAHIFKAYSYKRL